MPTSAEFRITDGWGETGRFQAVLYGEFTIVRAVSRHRTGDLISPVCSHPWAVTLSDGCTHHRERRTGATVLYGHDTDQFNSLQGSL